MFSLFFPSYQNSQWVCLFASLCYNKRENGYFMVRKGNKWHRKKYFLTRKKSKSHTFDTHHPHHTFLGFFPDPPDSIGNFTFPGHFNWLVACKYTRIQLHATLNEKKNQVNYFDVGDPSVTNKLHIGGSRLVNYCMG